MLVFVPFVAFALAFAIGAICLFLLVKRSRINLSTGAAGQTIDIQSPIGTFHLEPHGRADRRLSSLLRYPGSLAQNPAAAEYQVDVCFDSRHFTGWNTSYWTPDAVQTVWDFYRQQLPDWNVNLSDHSGRELVNYSGGLERKIRVYRSKDRTVIEHSVKLAGQTPQ